MHFPKWRMSPFCYRWQVLLIAIHTLWLNWHSRICNWEAFVVSDPTATAKMINLINYTLPNNSHMGISQRDESSADSHILTSHWRKVHLKKHPLRWIMSKSWCSVQDLCVADFKVSALSRMCTWLLCIIQMSFESHYLLYTGKVFLKIRDIMEPLAPL